MAVIEWIQFLIGAGLLLAGLAIFLVEMIGVFRFKYVLNRMQAAAMGDTLGIGFALVGLIVMSGISFISAKLLLVIIFLWFASPVSSHLIARLEVTTNEDEEQHYRVVDLRQLEVELAQRKTEGSERSEEPESGRTAVSALDAGTGRTAAAPDAEADRTAAAPKMAAEEIKAAAARETEAGEAAAACGVAAEQEAL